jgi:hypothetical protein
MHQSRPFADVIPIIVLSPSQECVLKSSYIYLCVCVCVCTHTKSSIIHLITCLIHGLLSFLTILVIYKRQIN